MLNEGNQTHSFILCIEKFCYSILLYGSTSGSALAKGYGSYSSGISPDFCVCMKLPISSLFVISLAKLRIFLTPSLEERTCPSCGRVFDTALLCRKHQRRRACKLMRTLLKCADCLQEFAKEEEMKTHRNSCRNTTTSQQFPCDVCDFIADSTGQCCRRPAGFSCRLNRKFLQLPQKILPYAAIKLKSFGAILLITK
jgi:hypothetical protein